MGTFWLGGSRVLLLQPPPLFPTPKEDSSSATIYFLANSWKAESLTQLFAKREYSNRKQTKKLRNGQTHQSPQKRKNQGREEETGVRERERERC